MEKEYLKEINNEFKSWLLGRIIANESISSGYDYIYEIYKNNNKVLLTIERVVDGFHIQIKSSETGETIESIYLEHDLQEYKDLEIPDELLVHYVRGIFENDGKVCTYQKPKVIINTKFDKLISFISSLGIPYEINKTDNNYCITYNYVNALDFLGHLYDKAEYKSATMNENYLRICSWDPSTNPIDQNILVAKTRKDAIIPSKSNVSDSGYDLTIIDKFKSYGDVTLYETGIKVTPPMGYYFQVVPRSSISKTGYILANNIGIIDRSYTGSIKVALIKVDKSAPDLELPCRIAQMIPTRIEHIQIKEVDELEETQRGEGGFGSTGT